MIRTTAPQQGHMAAGARSCVLAGVSAWNAPAEMTMDFGQGFGQDFGQGFGTCRTRTDVTTKRPTRHLGGLPT